MSFEEETIIVANSNDESVKDVVTFDTINSILF